MRLGFSIQKTVVSGFGVAILALLALGAVAYRATTALIAAAAWRSHTYQVLDRLENLLSDVTTLEMGRRGYVITAEERYLDPSRAALLALPRDLAELRALLADNPAQERKLDALEPPIRAMVALHTRPAERGATARAAFDTTGEAKDLLDRIRVAIRRMEAEENALLHDRDAAVRARARTATRVIVLGSASAVLLVALAFVRIARESARRTGAERRLEEQKGLLESVMSSIGDGVVVADEHARFVLFNPAAERIVGLGATETTPAEWAQTYGVFLPDALTPFPAGEYPLVRALRGEEVDQVEQFLRNPKLPDGAFITVTARPLRGADGSIKGSVAVFHDVTAQKRAEERIRALNHELAARVEELTAVNQELEAFSYSVSHDLRAPLRHIHGFVDLLRERASAGLDAKGRRYLEVISGAAKRMGALIDDLLSFSRMGRSEMLRAPVGLDDVARSVIEEVRREAAGRDIVFSLGDLPVVNGDRAMLRVVLTNLVSNAVKYTRPRRPALIEIGAQNGSEREAVVFVKDNGVGFDMQYAPKLFGVFQRLHRAEEFEGTGIGLATVRRIVHRHGGRTWAEAAPGAGASFFFSLPSAQGGPP